jgi:coronin-1B/1C/6
LLYPSHSTRTVHYSQPPPRTKKVRICDPRQQTVAVETDGHQGTKGSRAVWLGNLDKIFTVGFTRMSERHLMLFDPRKMDEPINNTEIDVSSGVIMPFYDEDTSIMYLAGKGDGNIRFYEIVPDAPYVHFISAYKSTNPQRGMGMVPKYALDTSQCEVTRLLKLESNQVQPIMFQVPRKATNFQADIYPDTRSFEPALTAEEYFDGKDADPKLMSVKPEENEYLKNVSTFKMESFVPKVKPKPKTELPPKTHDPKELLKQNEELRARVEKLEKENFDLKEKVKDLEEKLAKE